MRRYLPLFVLATIVFFLLPAGCGGGGGGGDTSPTPTPSPTATPTPTTTPHITLGWGERSRATGNLTSALSAVVRLTGARSDGSDLVFGTNRTGTAAYTGTITAAEPVRVGTYPMTVTFYADVNATVAIVGIASATVNLGTDGSLPDVAVVGIIRSVEIPAGQQAMVGQKSDLSFTARRDDNVIVPVTPGSASFSVQTGSDKLHFVGGQAEGLLPGNATVVATVDGLTSAPMDVHVGSNATVTVAPNPTSVSINGTVGFTAQVSNTSNQAVNWSLVEGAAGGVINSNGHYTAPATPGTYHVQAVSQYDPDKSATVTVTVEAGSVSVGGDFPESGGVGVTID